MSGEHRWVRGVEHDLTEGEEAAIIALQDGFADAGYRFSQLLVDLATSEAFRRPGDSP